MQAAEEGKRGQEECYAYYTLTYVFIDSLKASQLYLIPIKDKLTISEDSSLATQSTAYLCHCLEA